MFGIPAKYLVAGVGLLALCVTIYAGYRHYANLVDDKARLTAQVSTLEAAINMQKAATQEAISVIAEWKDDREKLLATLDTVNQNAKEARHAATETHRIFAKHDLDALAKARPGLISRRISGGTADAFRLLECASYPGGRCPD